MLSGRRSTAFMALVALLLLSVIPTIAGAVAADEGTYVDYFLGDLFQNPGKKMEPKTPRFRPWQIFNVSGQSGVLAFNCAGDVPRLNFVPRSDHPKQEVHSINGSLPLDTCGGGGGTPVQYKFSRPAKPTAGYSALFWARHGGGEENGAPLMPVPKLQLKAILKALAAMMEAAWRDEKGEAMPESVPFPSDTVAFYVKELGWLVVMGREDVEFRKPWEKMERKMGALTLGAVVV